MKRVLFTGEISGYCNLLKAFVGRAIKADCINFKRSNAKNLRFTFEDAKIKIN